MCQWLRVWYIMKKNNGENSERQSSKKKTLLFKSIYIYIITLQRNRTSIVRIIHRGFGNISFAPLPGKEKNLVICKQFKLLIGLCFSAFKFQKILFVLKPMMYRTINFRNLFDVKTFMPHFKYIYIYRLEVYCTQNWRSRWNNGIKHEHVVLFFSFGLMFVNFKIKWK